MKTGTLAHIKMRRLRKLLGKPLYQTAGVLECVWHLACECAEAGDIYTDEEIADYIEWDDEPAALIAALVESGFLDVHPQHRLVIHDWDDHRLAYIAQRIAKRGWRERHKITTCVKKTEDSPRTVQQSGILLPGQANPGQPRQGNYRRVRRLTPRHTRSRTTT